jgi:hypothetical protein
MSAKKTRRGRRPQYRATTVARAASLPPEAFVDIAQSVKDVVENEEQSTRPLSAVSDPSASVAQRPDEPPTVILTPAQVALLSKARPPQTVVPTSTTEEGEGYAFTKRDDRPVADAPTIILNVDDLLAMSAPAIEAPMPPPPLPVMPAPAPQSLTPTRKRELPPLTETDRDAELALLRSQRLARENGEELLPDPGITGKLREWWDVMQPGIDRVLGRTHRAGSRGARATIYQTSAQLPVVTVRPSEGGEGPSLQRLSQTARAIGERAQTAARPALDKVHSRAEQLAQGIVDRIDERFGGRPPLQHVLLGPGRMIVSFAPNITIRDAQTIIATAQARSLRRIVGYNAYLVMVPPGREARYADRLHRFRQVTGVHFGPQRSAQLPSTRASEAI